MFRDRLFRATLFLLLNLGVACAPGAATPAPTPALPTPAPTLPPTESPTPSPEPSCPEPTTETAFYRNEEHGYCLLYPEEFEIQTDPERPDEVVLLAGPPIPEAGMHEVAVQLRIAFNGPADGLDTREYARLWQQRFYPEFPLESREIEVGGHPAILIRDIPGMFAGQAALLVPNQHRYRLSLRPQPGDVPDLTQEAEEAWNTVTNSIVFFEPTVEVEIVRPEDVCPDEGPDTTLHINLVDGFCLLFPDAFEEMEEFTSGFEGGPVIAELEGFGAIRANLVVGTAGHTRDETPRELLEPRLEYVEPDSIEERTVGGAPAVTFIDPRGPFPSRQAMIVANNTIYTIVNQPYAPERYPEAMAHVDLIWQSVTESLTFFTPWR
jgi:hypothetical protein